MASSSVAQVPPAGAPAMRRCRRGWLVIDRGSCSTVGVATWVAGASRVMFCGGASLTNESVDYHQKLMASSVAQVPPAGAPASRRRRGWLVIDRGSRSAVGVATRVTGASRVMFWWERHLRMRVWSLRLECGQSNTSGV